MLPLVETSPSALEKVTKSFVFAPWFASVTVITDEPSVAVKNVRQPMWWSEWA